MSCKNQSLPATSSSPLPPAAVSAFFDFFAQWPLKAHLTCSDASVVGNDRPINQRPTHL